MWNPDVAPRMGFEALAKRYGLAKARRLWRLHELRVKAAEREAAEQEARWARERERAGPVKALGDLDMYPKFHLSPYTYKALWRSTLNQRGCTGGEALQDEEYMRDFLKRYPECRPGKVTSGDIRSGWTSALERAAKVGKMERAMQHAVVHQRLKAAAGEGRVGAGVLITSV